MIQIKYVIFGLILGYLIIKIYKASKTPYISDGMDLETLLWIIALIVFLILWGGIFWW
jgi:hypothetical protein